MSFRRRLTLFFVLIVLVPMVGVSVFAVQSVGTGERVETQVRLVAGARSAAALFREAQARSARQLVAVASDRVFADALQSGAERAATRRARALLRERNLTHVALVRRGRAVITVGQPSATAYARRTLIDSSGRSIGELQASAQHAGDYVELIEHFTSLHVVLRRGGATIATTLPPARRAPLPHRGEVELDGTSYSTSSFAAPGFAGQTLRVTLLAERGAAGGQAKRNRVLATLVLLGFFVLAVTFALTVSRALQHEVAKLLHGARRLGAGDLSARIPTGGADEFAALGEEFNKMAGQLEARIEELGRERERVERSVRRLGLALASNLDRNALLEIVLQTTVESVGASAGRAIVRPARSGPPEEHARVGDVQGVAEVMRAVEDEALVSREPRALSIAEVTAMAHPLREDGGTGRVVGVISVGRGGRRFTAAEEALFNYLAAQAAVSMKNVELHETVTRESLTDELTGLSNRRRFDEVLAGQAERARRFGHSLGLVLFDIDNFKLVNDTYGHQQGDVVLREVGAIMQATCREIDEPARYGGEELAVVLPETDLEGALELAERVRRRVAALRLPLVEGGHLQITVSCGAAALPRSASHERELVAAADGALYEAKRSGKNRTARAGELLSAPAAA